MAGGRRTRTCDRLPLSGRRRAATPGGRDVLYPIGSDTALNVIVSNIDKIKQSAVASRIRIMDVW